jgi:hypothetical protein
MSDKTKRLRDDARIRRQSEEGRRRAEAHAKANPPPQCLCGLTHLETTIICIDMDRWRPPKFYCRGCAPPEVRELVWPDLPSGRSPGA